MGKAISYCYKCSTLLREDDFERGKAVHAGDNVACAACAPEMAPPAPPRTGSSSKHPAMHRYLPAPSTRRTKGASEKSNALMIAGGVGGAVVLIVLLIVAMGGKDTLPPPLPSPPEPVPKPYHPTSETPKTPVKPAPAAAREALEAAKKFARDHPDDVAGQVREYTSVALQWDRAPEGQEAMKEVERLKAEVKTRVEAALAELEKELQKPREQKDFGAAREVFEKVAKRMTLSEWELALKKRTREVREELWKALDADPDLVAHWPFDEGTGLTTRDTTGHGHDGNLIGGITWSEGKTGLGLRFDGEGSGVEIPGDPVVDGVQKESYTLALWFKPDDVPPGKGDQNNAAYGLIEKPGRHLGIAYTASQRFHLDHWLESGNGAVDSPEACPPGVFYHVAAVVDRPAGLSRLYLNGQLKGSKNWTPNAKTYEYSHNPWRIGIAGPGSRTYAWPAKGVIDDVQMYKKALGADEVRRIYELSR
jgi:hypothetical protein